MRRCLLMILLFDRGLHAFRTFFDYDKMSLAILLTKSNDLAQYLNRLSHNTQRNKIKDKHVIINKHMKKLLTRLEAGINGGCPVLVFGITNNLLSRGA
jgi:CRISPR-associated protein Csd2